MDFLVAMAAAADSPVEKKYSPALEGDWFETGRSVAAGGCPGFGRIADTSAAPAN
jgi:hypothetical protein